MFRKNRIYLKVGGETADGDLKEKAVRKVVRTVIEKWGSGDGEATKKKIDARYPWGAVWWMGSDGRWTKIAQWDASRQYMELLGDAVHLRGELDAYMQ